MSKILLNQNVTAKKLDFFPQGHKVFGQYLDILREEKTILYHYLGVINRKRIKKTVELMDIPKIHTMFY